MVPEGVLDDADVLAPSQFYDITHATTEPSPEAKLLLALLGDAISCLLSRNPKLELEARRWVQGDGPSLITFEVVCAALGIEVEWCDRPFSQSPAGLTCRAECR